MEAESNVRENCEAVLHPLSDREEQVKEHVMNNIFAKLKLKDWEGVEVREYWKNMEGIK